LRLYSLVYDDGREYVEEYDEKEKIGIKGLHIDYETSKADEDECPVCFSKRDVNDKECSNCGYNLNKILEFVSFFL